MCNNSICKTSNIVSKAQVEQQNLKIYPFNQEKIKKQRESTPGNPVLLVNLLTPIIDYYPISPNDIIPESHIRS